MFPPGFFHNHHLRKKSEPKLPPMGLKFKEEGFNIRINYVTEKTPKFPAQNPNPKKYLNRKYRASVSERDRQESFTKLPAIKPVIHLQRRKPKAHSSLDLRKKSLDLLSRNQFL